MYNIMDYGAAGDGMTNDAPAIQKAIDKCSSAGGGVVMFPGGHIYRSGYVLLKSNVEIHLEMGAVWKASDHLTDYYPLCNDGKITAHKSGLPSFLNSEYAGRPFHGMSGSSISAVRVKMVFLCREVKIIISKMFILNRLTWCLIKNQNGRWKAMTCDPARARE